MAHGKKTGFVTLQKRAIRVIHNAHYICHTEPKFKSSGILKIPDLLVYQSLLFMFDYTRPARQSRLFYIPLCYAAFTRKQPLYSMPVIWNDWAKLNKSENVTRRTFKRHVKSCMLSKYRSFVHCQYDKCSGCQRL